MPTANKMQIYITAMSHIPIYATETIAKQKQTKRSART